jgi:c-di-GMP-binding flagellar brake protein YcgR
VTDPPAPFAATRGMRRALSTRMEIRGNVHAVETRRGERHRAHFRIVYDDGDTYSVALVRDISETGLGIECPNELAVGAVLRLEPADPDEDELFELEARVVRRAGTSSEGLHRYGLELADNRPRTRSAIEAMIARIEARTR